MSLLKYVLSFDISTTNIGMSLFDIKGKLIEMKHLQLKIDKSIKTEDRLLHKAKIFKEYILEFKQRILDELNGEIQHIIIEAPLCSSNNNGTVLLLYEFNGICTYILHEIFDNIYPLKISVHDSRKLCLINLVHQEKRKGELVEVLSFPEEYKDKKKLYIWEKVKKLEPDVQWFYKKDGEPSDINFDMSDSLIVGIAGLITLDIISKNDWKNKYMLIC